MITSEKVKTLLGITLRKGQETDLNLALAKFHTILLFTHPGISYLCIDITEQDNIIDKHGDRYECTARSYLDRYAHTWFADWPYGDPKYNAYVIISGIQWIEQISGGSFKVFDPHHQ